MENIFKTVLRILIYNCHLAFPVSILFSMVHLSQLMTSKNTLTPVYKNLHFSWIFLAITCSTVHLLGVFQQLQLLKSSWFAGCDNGQQGQALLESPHSGSVLGFALAKTRVMGLRGGCKGRRYSLYPVHGQGHLRN